MKNINITMFSSDTWHFCVQAKDWMKEEGIEFIERNINSDPSARKELIKNGFMGVPVFYIGDEVIQGFDRAKIEELVK